MSTENVVLRIENKIEDYYPAYPNYRKNYFRRDPWIKYLTPVLAFLMLAGIWFTVKTPRDPMEFGYTWTGVLVLTVFISGRIWILADYDKDVRKTLEMIVAKGPYEATLDSLGMQMRFDGNVEKIYWRNLGQLYLDKEYMMFQDMNYEVLVLMPKGNITKQKWMLAHDLLLSVSDKMYAEADKQKSVAKPESPQ